LLTFAPWFSFPPVGAAVYVVPYDDAEPRVSRAAFSVAWVIFLPITTVIYTLLVTSGYPIGGLYLVALVICAVADLGLIGGGASRRR